MNLGTAQISDFEPLLQETFRADLAGQTFELMLAEAQSASDRRGMLGMRAPFSLLFQGPPGMAFTQGVFPLTHAQTGTLEIFLVPVAHDAEGRTMLQAVFG